MSEATLWSASVFSVVTALLYLYIGRRVWRRPVSGEARLAAELFAVWWVALAASSVMGLLLTATGAVGHLTLPFVVTATYLNLFFISVALWGLLYYLIYLYTGRRRALAPLSAFYLLYYSALVYYVSSHGPVGFIVGDWSIALEYRTPVEGDPIASLLLALLVLPQIIGAFLYFLLYFRVEGTTQRFRILVVSWSIIIWFGTALVGPLSGLNAHPWWPIATRTVAVLAALAILAAYAPPGWLRARFGLTAIDEPVPDGGIRP